ncbi:MAG: hypothetical protein E7183_04005 [Erysipelotrichaceae bacterium]|nr:hypothetical protein [Erysipelotrichaceae bacterium]
MLKFNKEESYNLGKELGENLNEVHLLKVDVQKHHIPNWHDRYKWTQKGIIRELISNSIIEKAYNYYKDNEDIIEKRYSSSEYYHKKDENYVLDENGNCIIEKVLSFIFSDIKFENLIVSNKKVYVKCPINIAVGDSFYDFKCLSLIALENEYFASGVIDGYFKGNISTDFF